MLPYTTYCEEVWGLIFMLQRKAIRIVNHTDYYEPTNPLFLRLYPLKLEDLVNLNTAAFMYKAHNNTLPCCVQELFEARENRGRTSFCNRFEWIKAPVR